MEPEEYDRLFALEDEHWRFRALRRLLGSALRRHAPRPARGERLRLLDAGCGTGANARALGELGRVTAIDLHPRALGLAARRGLSALARASVSALPFRDGAFDVVVSVDVLYHRAVSDDAAALAELARVCRPGGVVLLWLAAYEWMRSAHDVVVHTERRYTRRSVEALARRAGLEVVRAGYANALLFPAAALHRWWTRGAPAPRSDVQSAPAWLNAGLAHLLGAEHALALRLPLPFGLSVFAVLRRPAQGSPR